jgi:hypothetical protein
LLNFETCYREVHSASHKLLTLSLNPRDVSHTMAIQKPFLQVFPGQNDPNIRPRKGKEVDPAEWERKQRLKEYRIAANREKRNRKSDEKKQRKLNATILRRMTRNTTKYIKNAGRNRLRGIEQERRKIQDAAILMAQRLAAVYDPSGAMFNVKPVVTLEDGRVVTVEAVERRKEKEAEQTRQQEMKDAGLDPTPKPPPPKQEEMEIPPGMNEDRLKLLTEQKFKATSREWNGVVSKTQQKKAAKFESKPPPPKPVIPEGIELPSDEEEDWLALWDLGDAEIEKRILRMKRKATKARKDLRIKQKSGKAERRAARDEKRRVYREIKHSWKVVREEERRRRKQLLVMEDEETKRIAVEVARMQRAEALKVCRDLGFTLENVEGVDDIKPRAMGMKGQTVPFDKLEMVGERPSGLKVRGAEKREKPRSNRIDLGAIPGEDMLFDVTNTFRGDADLSMNANFVELGSGAAGQEFEALKYNHKLRRKLRRALENTQISKELLVRERAIAHCEEKGIPVDPILLTPGKPKNVKGARTMPDGQLETAKQERVRSRVELAEFNRWAKILRRQAKEQSIEAGIRIYLELMELIPKREGWDEWVEEREAEKQKLATKGSDEPINPTPIGGIWPAQSSRSMHQSQSMAELMDSFDMPEDPNADAVDGDEIAFNAVLDGGEDEQMSSEDSASKQIRSEMRVSLERGAKKRNREDSDEEMSDDSEFNEQMKIK